MHEFSIADSIITALAGQLKPGQKLVRVMVTIGPLSGISGESLSFCFTELAQQAGLGSPELAITSAPARLKCGACAAEYEAESFHVTCPQCGSLERTVLSGSEFTVDSMEVEE